jgi:isocitrate dehydrogenase
MKGRIAILGGDGIGPEVVAEAVRVLEAVASRYGHEFQLEALPFGGAAIDAFGDGLPPHTLQGCVAADGVLLGQIGGPEWGPATRRCARSPPCCACARNLGSTLTCVRSPCAWRCATPRQSSLNILTASIWCSSAS